MLWAACRHHVLELFVNKVVEAITGHTEDPGVRLFRRFKKEWSRMTIDYSNLCTFSTSNLPRWMEEEAAEVLAWGQGHLLEGTFPRGDYREFLQLVVSPWGARGRRASPSRSRGRTTTPGGCPRASTTSSCSSSPTSSG